MECSTRSASPPKRRRPDIPLSLSHDQLISGLPPWQASRHPLDVGFATSPLPGRRPILVIASGNAHKVAEISAMLDTVDLEVQRQPEGLEIEETGATYLENARLKAEAVARLTGCWALADDSGLEVDALAGAPGLYSARYAPTDHERIQRLLDELGGTPYRSASFNSAMVLANPEGMTVLEAEGICRGEILTAPQGDGGGYDPIFWVREAGMTYAQMSQHQKDRLGSRGKAARALANDLKQYLGVPIG